MKPLKENDTIKIEEEKDVICIRSKTKIATNFCRKSI